MLTADAKERVQMSEKVVLPKFDLPGDRMHPAMKAFFAVCGLMVAAMLVLGGALWHRRSLQLAAEARQEALIAARMAEANAAAEAAKARAAEAAARAAAAQAAAQARLAARTGAASAPAAVPAAGGDGKPSALGRHHTHHRGAAGKTVAKADDKKSTAKTAGEKRDDAAIDKLLASFKK